VTPAERQRLLVGLLLAVHDSDERGYRALLNGVPRPALVAVMHSLAELVVNGQLVTEEQPGSARDRLAREALGLVGR
jgi:hypothetical protein